MKKETKSFLWLVFLFVVVGPLVISMVLMALWYWFSPEDFVSESITASEAVIDREDCETYCHNVGGVLVGITRHRTSEETECMCEVYVDEEGYED